MASVSFTLPMNPVMISAAKKKGSVFGFALDMLVLAALVAFIWWFYKAVQKNAAPPPPAPVAAEVAPTPPPTPQGAGTPESVPSSSL